MPRSFGYDIISRMERLEPYRLPIIGARSQEQEDRLRQHLFEDHLAHYEASSSQPDEERTFKRELVAHVNELICLYFSRLGIEVPAIPEEIVYFNHSLPSRSGGTWTGSFIAAYNHYGFRDTLSSMIHETLHAISTKRLWSVQDGPSRSVKMGSSGLDSRATRSGTTDLNEGLTQLLTMRIFALSAHPEMEAGKPEDDWKTRSPHPYGEAFQEEPIYSVRLSTPGDNDAVPPHTYKRLNIFNAYPEQRRMLATLIRIISKRMDTPEETVFDFITHCYIQSRPLPVARLIERSLGPGAFRMLVDMDGSPNEFNAYLVNKFENDIPT